LKGTEEPHEFVYWFFCTTEAGKVPATMKTRAARFELKAVDDDLLAGLLDKVMKAEKISLVTGVHDLLVKSAKGSPRQLLVSLAGVRDCASRKEAADILKTIEDSDVTLKLCQLVSGAKPSWAAAMALLEDLKDESPEGVRIQVIRYLAKVAMSASSNDKASKVLNVMQAWEHPYNESEGNAPLLLSIGRSFFD
jgi:DNA polymerase III gamma/tau subunit